jgi:hypothetical protein
LKRYSIRPRSADYDIGPDGENYLSKVVFIEDVGPFDTGILDQHGNMIVMHLEPEPFGFCLAEFAAKANSGPQG